MKSKLHLLLSIFLLACLCMPVARAQTAVDRAALYAQIDALFADTGLNPITPADMRTAFKSVVASALVPLTDGTPAAGSHTHLASAISDSTAIGRNFMKLPDPGSIVFLRINADNTISVLDAASYRAAIGAGTSSFDGNAGSLIGTLDPARLAAGTGLQVLRRNAANNALEFATISAGGGDMITTNNLSDVTNAITAFNNIKQTATTSATGVVELATDGESAPNLVPQANDSRLSNTRTPTDGSVTAAKVAASLKPSGTAAAGDEALRALGTTPGTAAAGDDSRLSNERTPTSHASSHIGPGSDPITVQMSIANDASGLKLSGDSASPGNSKYYGTNSGGTKGFHDLPSGGGSTSWGSTTGETDVASATTTDIGAATTAAVRITGTTTITGLGTVSAGTMRAVRFAGALTLTHNATSLILPSSANITTVAGDSLFAVSLGSGNWKVLGYWRQDGSPLAVGANLNYGTNPNEIVVADSTVNSAGWTTTHGYKTRVNGLDLFEPYATFDGSGNVTEQGIRVNGGKLLQNLSAYSTGTVYSLTNTAAALVFGTTSPSITIPTAGTWKITARVQLAYAGATVSTETVTLKLRRTNNTAADLTNGSLTVDLPVATTLTNTYGTVTLPPVYYTTLNANDVVTIFGNVSATLGAGTINCEVSGTNITAERLY